MRLILSAVFVLCATNVAAFTPSVQQRALYRPTRKTTARSLGIDPFHVTDAIQQFTSSIMLSDAVDAATSMASTTMDTLTEAVSSAVSAAPVTPDAVVEAAADDNGWFGFLTLPIEGLLQIIHSLIAGTGTANAWGVTIIVLTILIKVVTFPLTKTQLESTNKMQAMAPAIKELQAKYQSNPEVMNQKIAEFYQTNEINPLAGCLPSLAQIPIFIGLYRAVLDLAKENKLDEPFLFLPNLEGPTYGADPATAADWILQGWVDGTPSLGWDDTLAFLILPVFLVVSQFVSMELMQPKTDDPAQQQSNLILKFLPLMIGWFSLSVPAALSLYWVINNIVTTATSVLVRSTMTVAPAKTGGSATATMSAPSQTIFSPPREKPSGFGDRPVAAAQDGVKPITSIDADIVDSDDGDDDDDSDGTSATSEKKKKRRKLGKKKKN